jgi:hypothetical protein
LKQYPSDINKYALGLSMGGLTSFRLADQFKAVVLMAPAIQRFKKFPGFDVTANVQARQMLKNDPWGYKP